MGSAQAWVNGRRGSWVDVADRGFQYGDGLFETFRVCRGVPVFWQAHLERLRLGCARLAIPFPGAELLRREAGAACARVEQGVLKLQLTRGAGGRGYRLPARMVPTRVFSLYPLPDRVAIQGEGVRARLCHTRLGINPVLAGIKHCNRLEQILARREWDDPAVFEGLMCDAEGFLVEGTATNLFWCRAGVLMTPRVDRCGVAGIVRGWVLERVAGWGVPFREVRAGPEALVEAEEIFLTNSVIGVVPVVEITDANGPGSLRPVGSLTARLQADWMRCLTAGVEAE